MTSVGDIAAFGLELEALRPKLLAYGRKLSRNEDTAQDLVQTTMLKAIASADTFDGANLDAWACTILRNAFLTQQRKSGRNGVFDEDAVVRIPDESPNPLEQLETASNVSEAMDMLGTVRPESRKAIELIATGKTYAEIAQLMDVPEGTVKSRIARARADLIEKRGHRVGEPIRQRRFEELPTANPEAVVALGDDHPAILQSKPLFETMVVSASESPRVLISGMNSRKIGKVVTKGAWKGFPIFTLTLAERTTCPSICHMWKSCYGNAMPFARRHKPGADLEAKLISEVRALAEENPQGFVVRLHVLGDFYSEGYVALWGDLLKRHPNLHVFGYTARMRDTSAPAIGNKLFQVRNQFPDRFCTRPSEPKPLPGAAVVIDRVPDGPNVAEGLVCPAEREATACCATCGLCWEKATRDKTIVFVKHGMGSVKNARIANDATRVDAKGLRKIEPIKALFDMVGPVANQPPTLMWIDPTELRVDESYQRNLSKKSIRLIMRIIREFNWSHYKMPVVAKDEDTNTFYVIDGQHTAIACATIAAKSPKFGKIPISVVDAETLADRAKGFISHNQNRINVLPVQLHYSSIIAGDAKAVEIDTVCNNAGITILRMPPNNGQYRPGETMALGSIKSLINKYGAESATRVLSCLRHAERIPVRSDEMKALAVILLDMRVATSDAAVAMLAALPYEEAIFGARSISASTGVRITEALATVYAQRLAGVSADMETAA